MKLIVKNSEQKLTGTVTFAPDNTPMVEGGGPLTDVVRDLVKTGVNRREDHTTDEGKALFLAPIEQSNPGFPLALKESLEMAGFIVTIDHPEVMDELMKLLEDIPNDDPEKIELLKRFPELSYLEQTYVLKQFSEIE